MTNPLAAQYAPDLASLDGAEPVSLFPLTDDGRPASVGVQASGIRSASGLSDAGLQFFAGVGLAPEDIVWYLTGDLGGRVPAEGSYLTDEDNVRYNVRAARTDGMAWELITSRAGKGGN